MAKKSTPTPAPKPAGKRRMIKRSEWFILIVIALILLYFLLQNMGMPVIEESEKIEMTDDPHPGRG